MKKDAVQNKITTAQDYYFKAGSSEWPVAELWIPQVYMLGIRNVNQENGKDWRSPREADSGFR